MKNVVIDVGANRGDFGLDVLSRNPGVTVLSIEPIPFLCQDIRLRKNELEIIGNLEIFECAIDLKEGESTFNIANHDDLGISSLLKLDTSLLQQYDYWKTRKDLYYDSNISVKVRRLDSILSESEVDRVLFIKIDAQGLDVNVLLSLGEYLPKTDAGMLEVPATLESKLYEGENYDLYKALKVIDELGFKTYAIKPNDFAANEFNIFFCRKELDSKVIEKSLNLAGISLYDGKHYWHAPSAQYRPNQNLSVDSYYARAEQAEYALELIYKSRSWRITRLLRALSTNFLKIKNNLIKK